MGGGLMCQRSSGKREVGGAPVTPPAHCIAMLCYALHRYAMLRTASLCYATHCIAVLCYALHRYTLCYALHRARGQVVGGVHEGILQLARHLMQACAAREACLYSSGRRGMKRSSSSSRGRRMGEGLTILAGRGTRPSIA